MLKNKRRHLGKSRKEVGQQLNMTGQNIEKYETGRNRIPLPQLIILFKALQIKFSELDFLFADVQPTGELPMQPERNENVERS